VPHFGLSETVSMPHVLVGFVSVAEPFELIASKSEHS
jgi:hypothetical protein